MFFQPLKYLLINYLVVVFHSWKAFKAIGWLGKNMMMYLKKTRIRGVRGGKTGEKRIFSIYFGEKYHFEKMGEGQKINYFDYTVGARKRGT